MPNYVYSTLELNGSSNDIKLFREKIEEDGKLIADKVIPYPRDLALLDKKCRAGEELTNKDNSNKVLTDEEERELVLIGLEGKYNMTRDGYNQGGYDWCIKNWGTKWGFCDCSVDEAEEEHLMYDFSTAWSPITPVILEMSRQFPKITFDYFCNEESGDFRDERTIENGVVTYYNDRTSECDEERKQEEEDYKLEEEESKRIEASKTEE